MLISDIHENTELADVARLFYGDCFPSISIDICDNGFFVCIDGNNYAYSYQDVCYKIIPTEHKYTRLAKIALYDALSEHTGREMPWGALTGVRPTKLFYECLRNGKNEEQACNLMKRVYRISDKRANVLKQIISAQKDKVNFPVKYCNLYIHIPYCTTRCTYCSFVSAPIDKNRDQARLYIDLLCDEIKRSVDFLHLFGKEILSVYIGGGTPTALDDALLNKLLDAIGNCNCEYTCEAGRPDTISQEKADIMKAHGVTRVCVNPQTLNQKTLDLIGRGHTVEQFYDVYKIIERGGFDINCDLIAGLQGETVEDFIRSADSIKLLAPHNITVHSLSKKNGSAIRYSDDSNIEVGEMIDYAISSLDGYTPYYLYRQKRQSGNLENIGFSLPNYECINNITTMEETISVMACGAGAISKTVVGDRITRFANMRDIPLYISRYAEKTEAKLEQFSTEFRGDGNSR